MTDTKTTLQPGQHYDPGYPFPELTIGTRISGRTVIAAVRQTDCAGYNPGLHTVVAYDPANGMHPYVTWSACWQPLTAREREAVDAKRAALGKPPLAEAGKLPGRWVASSGDYVTTLPEALARMARRAGGWHPREES